ncbi:MAG: glycosyl hydrolase family 18 protein [Chitinophagaceae bacterium]
MKPYNKLASFIAIIFCSISLFANAQFRIVGYLNTWDDFPNNINQVNLTKITHLNIAFANPDAAGNLTTFSDISTVVDSAHAHHIKVSMSLGGGDLNGTKKNWQNLTRTSNVKSFCNKILKYLQSNNLDGVDIDLEGNIIGDNYANFIETLSNKLKPQNKIVTAAVATWFANHIPASSFAYFDFVNIMSYDATGPWNPNHAGPSAPYSMAVNDIIFWSRKGLAQNKMSLGVPFYGWGFYNKFSQNEYAFRELVTTYPGAANADQISDTIYYNGIPTIKKKTRLAIDKASGIMIWQLTEDASGNKSLLNAIYETIYGARGEKANVQNSN